MVLKGLKGSSKHSPVQRFHFGWDCLSICGYYHNYDFCVLSGKCFYVQPFVFNS